MRRRTFAGVIGLGLLLSAGTLALLLTSDHQEAPAFAVTAQLLGAWSFILGGLVAWARRPDNRFGPLLTAVGLTVFVAALGASNNSIPVHGGLDVRRDLHRRLRPRAARLPARLPGDPARLRDRRHRLLLAHRRLAAHLLLRRPRPQLFRVPGERPADRRLPQYGRGHQRRPHRRRHPGAHRLALRLPAALEGRLRSAAARPAPGLPDRRHDLRPAGGRARRREASRTGPATSSSGPSSSPSPASRSRSSSACSAVGWRARASGSSSSSWGRRTRPGSCGPRSRGRSATRPCAWPTGSPRRSPSRTSTASRSSCRRRSAGRSWRRWWSATGSRSRR